MFEFMDNLFFFGGRFIQESIAAPLKIRVVAGSLPFKAFPIPRNIEEICYDMIGGPTSTFNGKHRCPN